MKSICAIAFAALLTVAVSNIGSAQPASYPIHAEILAAVEQINSDSIAANIERLVSFHTRHTYSDTLSNSTGIGAALRWVESKARSYGATDIEWFPWTGYYNGRDYTRHDLIVRFSGQSGDPGRYIIGGHIDSRTANLSDSAGFAPGADDNGSSCAALLELVRVLPDSLEHNLEIIWFTGEEQGLLGSEAYAQMLSDEGQHVDGMIAMDMISHIVAPGGGIDSMTVRLYAQGIADQGGTASAARNFQRYLSWTGRGYVPGFAAQVIAAADRPGRGSDHLPFGDYGFPSLRVIEKNEDLNYQHSGNDSPESASPTYARRVAMLTFGSLITMLNAPLRTPPPEVAIAGDSIIVTIPDTVELPAGGQFLIAVREGYDSDYSAISEIGNARAFVFHPDLPSQIYYFGLARTNADGLPSPISRETEVEYVNDVTLRETAAIPTLSLVAAPNPFNNAVRLEMEIPHSGPVQAAIFDLLGRKVAELYSSNHPAGSLTLLFEPHDLPTGIYLARVAASAQAATTKILYLK